MAVVATSELKLRVADVSGQKIAYVPRVPNDATVGELIEDMVPQLQLPRNDLEGRPLVYSARLQRQGRHLHGSEKVVDVLEMDDRITLQPNIEAGRY